MKSSFSISNFLEEVSSLSQSIVFPYFFALIKYTALLCIGKVYNTLLCIENVCNTLLKTNKKAFFLPCSDVYVRSFLCLFYSLIKLHYTESS